MASIFTKIVQGEIPCYKVAETEDYLAFLDIRPLQEGHTLVIPKQEVDYMFDLDESTYIGLHLFARHVAKAMDEALECKRIGTAVLGLEVPHCHVHLVPINEIGDLNFKNPPKELSPEQMADIAARIRAAVPGN